MVNPILMDPAHRFLVFSYTVTNPILMDLAIHFLVFSRTLSTSVPEERERLLFFLLRANDLVPLLTTISSYLACL